MPRMIAMQCSSPGFDLSEVSRDLPAAQTGEMLVQVSACGICRTDLHVMDGEIEARYPIIPGHEVVGRVVAVGPQVDNFQLGQRVGIPWLGHTCGICSYCREGRENLCDRPQFTGATRDGGFASHVLADSRYCFSLPDGLSDAEAAPLLCAGLIGWRAYRMAGNSQHVGLYGFGAAAHILAQVARWQGREVYAFTQPGDIIGQDFARSLGCRWAGSSDQAPPVQLDAAILFAPVGALVPQALKVVRKGGRVICAGIHMTDIPAFPYADLWGERQILSVANLTREDGSTFLELAGQAGIRPAITCFPLDQANLAIEKLRKGGINGAAVLVP
jgi:alcohol dehydrogenase, propanol-preferring